VNDWKQLLKILHRYEVDFLVVGSHAMAHHGYTRPTDDLDLFLRPSEANAIRARYALGKFGVDVTNDDQRRIAEPGCVIRIGEPPDRIDLATCIDGVTFEEAWGSRSAGMMFGKPVNFLGFDCLLQNKMASKRPKDAVDAAHLIEYRMASLQLGVGLTNLHCALASDHPFHRNGIGVKRTS
jgi:hypothetical protein